MSPRDAAVLALTMRSDGLCYRALRLTERIEELRREASGAGWWQRWLIKAEIDWLMAKVDEYEREARLATMRACDG